MEDCFRICESVSLSLLEALEIAMHVPRWSFTAKCRHNACEFRMNHYPTIDIKTLKEGNVNRIWPHFDLGVLTLLFQDGIGGLEIEDRGTTNQFFSVQPGKRTEMIINVSETLQRWTNGVLKAGLHQVTMPAAMKDLSDGTIPERYSVVYFCKADRDASVGTVAHFVGQDMPAMYEEMTALDYQRKRLLEAY